MSHSHFTLSDRIRIQTGLEDGLTRQAIADHVGSSRNAINSEIDRNSVVLEIVKTTRVNKPRILSLDLRTRRGKGEVPDKEAARKRYQQRLVRWERGQPVYDADIAQALYLARRSDASQGNRKLVDGNELARLLTERLTSKARDSPEQLANNLKKEGVSVCAQTIYNWIHTSSNRKILIKGLRRRGRRYRYSTATKQAWNKTREKRSIHDRPAVIEELIRYGDLEGDTIFGKDSRDRLLTHVDRATGVVSLSLVKGYDSHKIYQQTLKDVFRVFGADTRTITYDNGSEFAAWKMTEQTLQAGAKDKRVKAKIYFADPYRSSQRGRNENINGLVRDYFPKGTDFKLLTQQEIREVETILNNRSRKRYDWRSPLEQREMVLEGSRE